LTKTREEVVEEAMTRIELIKIHKENVQNAWRFSGVSNDISMNVLMSALWQKEVFEWMTIAMWGLTLTADQRDRIKAAAYEMFLKDGKDVSHWLHDGYHPGQWYSADEDNFRNMAAEAFFPWKGK
jgi:hypothetical protein